MFCFRSNYGSETPNFISLRTPTKAILRSDHVVSSSGNAEFIDVVYLKHRKALYVRRYVKLSESPPNRCLLEASLVPVNNSVLRIYNVGRV